MFTSNRHALRHLARLLVAATIAFSVVYALLLAMRSDAPARADTVTGSLIYLPVIYGPEARPAGAYDCVEYEFGQIWSGDLITLYQDGSSEYQYYYGIGLVSGAWTYTSSLREVGFTNFRWQTATFTPPDRMSNRQYLPGPGFEIAIYCTRRG